MRIVLPLDLSDTAARACDMAVQIAQGLGDQLVLVTVADQRLMSALREMAEAEHADPLELIETYLRGFSSDLEDVPHDYAVVPGDDAAEALIDFARGDETRIRSLVAVTNMVPSGESPLVSGLECRWLCSPTPSAVSTGAGEAQGGRVSPSSSVGSVS